MGSIKTILDLYSIFVDEISSNQQKIIFAVSFIFQRTLMVLLHQFTEYAGRKRTHMFSGLILANLQKT